MIHKVDLFSNDLYQFTTSYTYFMSGKHQEIATFEVFFRKHPFKGQYAICGGINAVKLFLANLHITEQQINFLKSIFPNMKSQYFEWLKEALKRQIKIQSMSEGQIVFIKQPIISYTGPISVVQLLETPFLNLIGFATLVATNASRMVKAAGNKSCVQFGLRRAQGPDGALSASHYSYLGGFTGTSNIQASHLFGIPCQGTMSHAFITSFASLKQACSFTINGIDIKERALQYRSKLGFKTHDGQLASFLMYAKQFNNTTVCLIDTYNTIHSGILNAIVVAKALFDGGCNMFGIRLDSGDLCEYSKKCRQIWNKFIPDHRLNIIASDDLNQQRIMGMEKNSSQIDVYAIGTNIATSQKQPALGLVCKLVCLNSNPVMKLSETTQKSTYPSAKAVYRIWTDDQPHAKFDLICLEDEQIGEIIKVTEEKDHSNKSQHKVYKKVRLNKHWKQLKQIQSLNQSKNYMIEAKKSIRDEIFSLADPTKHPIMLTQNFMAVLEKTKKINTINLIS